MGNKTSSQGTILEITHVYDLIEDVKEKEIVKVKNSDPLHKVLQVLDEHKILSAPVWSEEFKTDFGVIDVMDIACFVAYKRNEMKAISDFPPHIFDYKCYDAIDYSLRNPFLPVKKECTMKQAVDMMIAAKVHRLCVVDDTGKVVDIITQSGLVKWLFKHIDQIMENPDATIRELDLGFQRVITARAYEITVDVIQRIRAEGVSCIGVENARGQLVNALSARGLMGLTVANCNNLLLPIGRYVEVQKAGTCNTCNPETTFRSLIRAIVNARIHRMFIVDDDMMPLGVITLSDIIRLLYLNEHSGKTSVVKTTSS